MEKDLQKILKDNDISEKGKSAYKCIQAECIPIMKVRDILLNKGYIYYENLDEKYCIGSINAKGTEAAVVVKIVKNKIEFYAFARDGLFKKGVASKAIEIIRSEVEYELNK